MSTTKHWTNHSSNQPIIKQSVTLCGWSAKHAIPLSVLTRNIGLRIKISNETRSGGKKADLREARAVGKGMPEKAVGKRITEKAVGEGWCRGAVDNRQQKRPVGWDRVLGQWGKETRWVRSPELTRSAV